MFKRMIWLLALSAALLSFSGRVIAAEEGSEPKPGLLPAVSGERPPRHYAEGCPFCFWNLAYASSARRPMSSRS